MHSLIKALCAIGLLAPASAGAIGDCEGGGTTHRITHIAPDGRYVVTLSTDTCEAGDDDEEQMETTTIHRLHGPKGAVIGRFCAGDAPSDCPAASGLAARLKADGYVPVSTLPKTETDAPFPVVTVGATRCSARARLKALPTPKTAFLKSQVQLDLIQHGSKTGDRQRRRLLTIKTEEEHGDAQLIMLPTGGALLGVQVATCGGPPPGYFGEDDGGECLPELTHTVTVLPPPLIRACQPPAKASTPPKIPKATTPKATTPKAP